MDWGCCLFGYLWWAEADLMDFCPNWFPGHTILNWGLGQILSMYVVYSAILLT